MRKKLFFVTFVLAIFMIFGISAYASCNVVAVMYHNVTRDSTKWNDYCISPEQLESDIEYFTANGYITMTASELIHEDMNNLEGKKVFLITFDDGYFGWYTEVYPILQKYNAKATMFTVGSYIDRYGYLSKSQVREMANSGLVEFGNHTDNIHKLPLERVKNIYSNTNVFFDVINDIVSNADYLKSITGKEVEALSWPYGYYTSALDKEIRNYGVGITFSTNYGVNVYDGYSDTPLNRINREHSTTSEDLYNRAESKF